MFYEKKNLRRSKHFIKMPIWNTSIHTFSNVYFLISWWVCKCWVFVCFLIFLNLFFGFWSFRIDKTMIHYLWNKACNWNTKWNSNLGNIKLRLHGIANPINNSFQWFEKKYNENVKLHISVDHHLKASVIIAFTRARNHCL